MERREYLLNELPDELQEVYEEAWTFYMGNLYMGSVGFTLDGVRYRIYRDEQSKATAKAWGIDLQDALRGADVPAADVAAAMDKLGYDADDRRVVLAEIAERQAADTPGKELVEKTACRAAATMANLRSKKSKQRN